MAHIRVYDPRGFEFEISVENLLYILQECTSTKGKGLEGDFVYAFDGKDLVLLPTSSQEYISSRKFTDGLTSKVSKNDMKEGCVYITKKQEEVIYLGKQSWYDPGKYFNNHKDEIGQYEFKGDKHIFALVEEPVDCYECPYLAESGFTRISSKVSDVIATDYADRFDKFKKSIYGGGIVEVSLKTTSELPRFTSYDNFITRYHGDVYLVRFRLITRHWGFGNYEIPSDNTVYEMILVNKIIIEGNKVTYERIEKIVNVTFKDMKEMELFELHGKMLNGKTLKITHYY
jgi:hypothetical protein